MAKRLKHLVWTGSLSVLAACGGNEGVVNPVNPENPDEGEELVAEFEPPVVAEKPPVDLSPEARIRLSIERLDRLEVLETAELFSTRTEHQWVPYGGFWNSQAVEMTEAEVAERLEVFTARAEAALEAAEGTGISEGFDGHARCFALGQGPDAAHCLTIDLFEADLAALNNLEIIAVEGIVRDADAQQGMCYSSWITVTADDCARAHQLRAIVEATADLPASALPPPESPEGRNHE